MMSQHGIHRMCFVTRNSSVDGESQPVSVEGDVACIILLMIFQDRAV